MNQFSRIKKRMNYEKTYHAFTLNGKDNVEPGSNDEEGKIPGKYISVLEVLLQPTECC
jgi:hypothetical protein